MVKNSYDNNLKLAEDESHEDGYVKKDFIDLKADSKVTHKNYKSRHIEKERTDTVSVQPPEQKKKIEFLAHEENKENKISAQVHVRSKKSSKTSKQKKNLKQAENIKNISVLNEETENISVLAQKDINKMNVPKKKNSPKNLKKQEISSNNNGSAEAGTDNLNINIQRTGKKKINKPVSKSKSEANKFSNPNEKLKIIPLGGLNEIGKNMTVVEYGDDIIVIDCGLAFPDEEMPGVDLVIPDISYLETNRERLRGIFLTHGHEDHIGAIPYVLRNINPPIYGTKLTLGIVKNKLKEFTLPYVPKLQCVAAGDVVKVGQLSVEFIHVNHSIADACALAIKTPLGTIVHSGDFKLDLTPIDGEVMDIARLGELGKEGVLLLMCESTNAERPGNTPSERKVGASLEYIFTVNNDKRIVIATFSSNVHRVQQIIDTAAHHSRKVAITGRSMLNIVGAAVELGYMHVPDGVLIDISEIRKYRPDELTLVTTGSQGEPMSALYRMAFGEHREVTLGANDVVVLSSSAIPGNEKLVGRIVNELCKLNVKVIHDAAVEVHVSGHACQEELKLMQALTRPKYFMPVHGEYKHMAENRNLALYMGMDSRNIFISDIGKVLEIDSDGARFGGTVTSGRVLVDGYGVGDVGNIVLRDRRLLSQDGLIVVVATVSAEGGYILSGPDIVSRGFVYVRESEDLMDDMRKIALDAINLCLEKCDSADWFQIKGKVKDDLAKFILNKTKRKPMIIPMIMNI